MRTSRVVAVVGLSVVASAGCGKDATSKCQSSLSEDALSVCATHSSSTKGIDVSKYQGTINWTSVKNDGVQFAIARVSDGVAHPDAQFVTNWAAIRQQGLVRGVYQFFHPGGGPDYDALAQAQLVINAFPANDPYTEDDLPIVMDIEVTDSATPATIQANMHIWLDAIEQATGKKPLIYTANNMATNIGTGFGAYGLWVANWGVTCPSVPNGWTKWALWQNSATGTVAGISGDVDLDTFDGTLAEMRAFFAGTSATTDGGGPVTLPDGGTPSYCSVNGGHYCGGDGVTGDRDTLYVCVNHAATVEQVCTLGCVYEPSGVPDKCQAADPHPDAGPVTHPDAGPSHPDAGPSTPPDAGPAADAGPDGQAMGQGQGVCG